MRTARRWHSPFHSEIHSAALQQRRLACERVRGGMGWSGWLLRTMVEEAPCRSA